MTENAALFMECPEPRSTDAGAPEFETDTKPDEEYNAGEAAYPSAPADGLTPEVEDSAYADTADTEKPTEAPDAESEKALAIEEPEYEQSPSVPYEEADGDSQALDAYETDGSGYLPVGGVYSRRGYSPKYRFSGSFSHTRRHRSHPYLCNPAGWRLLAKAAPVRRTGTYFFEGFKLRGGCDMLIFLRSKRSSENLRFYPARLYSRVDRSFRPAKISRTAAVTRKYQGNHSMEIIKTRFSRAGSARSGWTSVTRHRSPVSRSE